MPRRPSSQSDVGRASPAAEHVVLPAASNIQLERRNATAAIIWERLNDIDDSLTDLHRWFGHRGEAGQRAQLIIEQAQQKLASLRNTEAEGIKLTAQSASETDTSAVLPSNIAGMRENIFPLAHESIKDWARFRWHRTHAGDVDADLPNSSQAFCISTWGTAASRHGAGVRSALAQLFDDDLLCSQLTQGQIGAAELEHVVAPALLGEAGAGNRTNLDVLWNFPGLTLAIESKRTEGFGSCSQVKAGHCTGTYGPGSDLKTRSNVDCRLKIADGRRHPRRYWEVLAGLGCIPESGRPCPLAGPEFQAMRVIAAAAEIARSRGTDWRVVFAYPTRFAPEPGITLERVLDRLTPEVQSRILTLDYEDLTGQLLADADATAQDLGSHLWRRLMACRHHDRWSMLTGVPTAIPRPPSKLRFRAPQYARLFERSFAMRGSQYISGSPHVFAFLHPGTLQLAFLIADSSGVRIRLEPSGDGSTSLSYQILQVCQAHSELQVIEPPSPQSKAIVAKIDGPYPDVYAVPTQALQDLGFLPVKEPQRRIPY